MYLYPFPVRKLDGYFAINQVQVNAMWGYLINRSCNRGAGFVQFYRCVKFRDIFIVIQFGCDLFFIVQVFQGKGYGFIQLRFGWL